MIYIDLHYSVRDLQKYRTPRAKEHGFPMENEHFVVARLLKQL